MSVIALTVYLVRAFDARRGPPLGPEHQISFEHEFRAAQEEETDWAAYLAIEDALAAELGEKIDTTTRIGNALDRYAPDSVMHPSKFDGNWNRSYEFQSAGNSGVAVMLHGLSDSPYTMLAMAQAAVGAGYDVVAPRLPGHGFTVAGLRDAKWQDWRAATNIAMRRAAEKLGDDESFLVVGYSNGGLLAVEYALRCSRDESSRCPDRIILLSPAIGVSPASVIANLHAAISWLPYFEKFQWLSVLPEVDPFKFTSFPKQAAWEIRKLAKHTQALLDDESLASTLPPILTFQSVVDNTVSSAAVISQLYERIENPLNEIVIYDVNRNSTVLSLMRSAPDDPIEIFTDSAPHDYAVTIVRTARPEGFDINVATLAANATEFSIAPSDLSWPIGIFSLSHIALPFSPMDPLYGDGSTPSANEAGVVLGAIAPRGEAGVLLLTPDYFLRTRYNPFHAFQVAYAVEWLDRQTLDTN